MSNPNPFEVLRLDPGASEEEIVRQAGRLRQRVADEAALTQIRQAVQALTAQAEERQRLALLTHPRPQYAAPLLDRLATAFRRSPASSSAPVCPDLDQDEFLTLLLARLVDELDQPQQAFEPVKSVGDPAEIQAQLAEALWQNLLSDMRA